MYGYIDYFDPGKRDMPYAGNDENLRDYFLMLDMLLEGYIRHKEFLFDEESFHARGIAFREEQIEHYFGAPPAVRFTDLPSWELKQEVMRAVSHIRSRENAANEVDLHVRRMVEEFSVSVYEIFVILIAASVERDLRYVRIYQLITGDYDSQMPTVGVVDAILRALKPLPDDYVRRLLSPESKLRTWFVEVSSGKEEKEPAGTLVNMPFLNMSLSLGETPWRYMQAGEGGCRLAVSDNAAGLASFFGDFAKSLAVQEEGVHFCYVEAQDSADVVHALTAVAWNRKQKLVVMNPEKLLSRHASRQIRDMFFEIRICRRMVLFLSESLQQGGQKKQAAEDACSYFMDLLAKRMDTGTYYFAGSSKLPQFHVGEMLAPAVCRLPLPNVGKRIRIWEYFLGIEKIVLADDVHLADIADCHELSVSSIRRVLREAKETMEARRLDILDRHLLQELIFGLSTSDFDYLATPIEVRYTWKDIFLEPSAQRRLKAACDRYRLRNRIGDAWGINQKNAYGNAVIVLMYGAPGTGKTMAAQAIANEVMTPLYRVDVSQIFSKYIGETQKNLSKIFDEAKKRNVVLFFDEADALFTKRTEIKDSHDKYSNSDTSFLLQKVEEYSGISILATNSYQSFDTAFMRRLTYVVHFERPSREVRLKMWKTMLPEQVPMDLDVDYEWLSERFDELSGSNIKSILLTAAYLAGAESRSVRMQDVILAVRYEFEKLGRLINSEEFGQYAIYMLEE